MKKLTIRKHSFYTICLTLFIFFQTSCAEAAPKNLAAVAQYIIDNYAELAKLITAGSYIAGFGFTIGAILKLKAHKDSPTQVSIGMPIALLIVAAALINLPTIFQIVGMTLFDSTQGVGGVSGVMNF